MATRNPPPPMPVARSTMRTERTHEENQERAYIAASRRSDRSLEARVESARRASEIHRRRTGRGLVVSEEEVLSDAMYDEEPDDSPLPYRQFTQRLLANDREWNHRLASHLATHIDIRTALENVLHQSHQISAQAAMSGASAGTSAPTTTGAPTNFASAGTIGDTSLPHASFSPSAFSPQSSNPPTPSPMNAMPPATLARLQSSGTQFHMGPVGLGTLPPAVYQGTYFDRRKTTPMLQIPHAPLVSNTYDSAALSAEQFYAMSQSLAREAANNGDVIVSPLSDKPSRSLHMGTGPSNLAGTGPSGESSTSRRMSMPVNAPPFKSSSYSRHLGQFLVEPMAAGRSGQSTQDLNTPTAARNQLQTPHTPGGQEPTTQAPFSDTDLGFLNFQLPQNGQGVMYGSGMNMQQPGIWPNNANSISDAHSPNSQDLLGDDPLFFSDSRLDDPMVGGNYSMDFSNYNQGSDEEMWREIAESAG
ncbi:hypothetical protein H072_564 [Dactylellina haptotyla CBS 200.50]|uniref:Uncharacterized protein n=1 Tax=Dactylellina haptotyla (strain CBS 200.50) TaxID=1284197 RepID=S8CCQ0_DACHA|nr:hypothetical protein H072_564 [Dactylellina haptotyla CBS 200.50]